MAKRYASEDAQQSSSAEEPMPPRLVGSFFIHPAPTSHSLISSQNPDFPEFMDDSGDDADQKRDPIFDDTASVDIDGILSSGTVHPGINVSSSCKFLEVNSRFSCYS